MLWLTLHQLKSSDEATRFKAIAELGKLPPEQAVEYLQPALSDVSFDVRLFVVRTLGKFEDPGTVEALSMALNDKFASVRQAAVEELGKLGESVTVQPLIARLDDSDAGVRLAAFNALERSGSIEGLQATSGRKDLSDVFLQDKQTGEKVTRFVSAGDFRIVEDRHTFASRLAAATPQAYASYIIIGINIAVFLAMLASGMSLIESNNDLLVRWGANYAPLTMRGQWWRLLTSVFLHIGILHIALNMWALQRSGPFIEKVLGPFFFVLVYISSAVFCGLVSIAVNSSRIFSVGASGGIFGIYGALLAYLILHKTEVPKIILQPLVKNVLFFVAANLMLGFTITGLTPIKITNTGNLVGVITGFLLGLVVARPLDLEKRKQHTAVRMAIGVACSIIATAIFYIVASRISITP